MIVYLARDIQAFVMYCVNGTSRSSLLIESTDSMILYFDPCTIIYFIPVPQWRRAGFTSSIEQVRDHVGIYAFILGTVNSEIFVLKTFRVKLFHVKIFFVRRANPTKCFTRNFASVKIE